MVAEVRGGVGGLAADGARPQVEVLGLGAEAVVERLGWGEEVWCVRDAGRDVRFDGERPRTWNMSSSDESSPTQRTKPRPGDDAAAGIPRGPPGGCGFLGEAAPDLDAISIMRSAITPLLIPLGHASTYPLPTRTTTGKAASTPWRWYWSSRACIAPNSGSACW